MCAPIEGGGEWGDGITHLHNYNTHTAQVNWLGGEEAIAAHF